MRIVQQRCITETELQKSMQANNQHLRTYTHHTNYKWILTDHKGSLLLLSDRKNVDRYAAVGYTVHHAVLVAQTQT